MADTKILGICGSLRKASLNMAALRAAGANAPDGISLDIANLSGIPVYNEEIYADGFPPAVDTFRAQIQAADALLFATPEYNYSIPGPLKNAIDWASRPPRTSLHGQGSRHAWLLRRGLRHDAGAISFTPGDGVSRHAATE